MNRNSSFFNHIVESQIKLHENSKSRVLEFNTFDTSLPFMASESNLNNTIHHELKLLKSQLNEIKLKLSANQEILLQKKLENDRIKEILDLTNLTIEAKEVSESSCKCLGKCSLF